MRKAPNAYFTGLYPKELVKRHRRKQRLLVNGYTPQPQGRPRKIDATGTLGIARTLFYKGNVGEPLYSILPDGRVSDGTGDSKPSFFQEYKYKLEKLYTRFFTARGNEIAQERRKTAVSFYEDMKREVSDSYDNGLDLLKKIIR